MPTQQALEVVRQIERAETLLNPVRLRLLSLLAEPGSASQVAERAGVTRQIANYHLRELEAAGFLHLVEERKRGNVTERVLVASARAYVLGPQVLGPVEPNPQQIRDRFSLDYLEALAARVLGEVSELQEQAFSVGGRVPSMSLEAAVKFRSPQDRSAFANELSSAVSKLAARYHDERAGDSETFRFLLVAHPLPKTAE